MADSVCESLPRPIVWPATIDRTSATAGIIPFGGFGIDGDDLFCDASVITSAQISIPVTVDTANGKPIDYQVTSTLSGSTANLTWTASLGGVTNAAGQLSGTASGTLTADVGALVGQSVTAVAGLAFGLTTAAGSQVTWGEPTLEIGLDNALCPEPEDGTPVYEIVKLCLASQTVTDCAGTVSQVEALPTVVSGVVDVRVCEEATLDWVPVFQCVIGDQLGVGVGGRDILDGEQIIANLLTDSSTGAVVNVVYVDPQDPTFTLPESIAVGDCPTPVTVIPRGCIRDTDGNKWDVFDADGSLFYVSAAGDAGVPSGNPADWGSCADPVSVDNLKDLLCEEEWPCPASGTP